MKVVESTTYGRESDSRAYNQ